MPLILTSFYPKTVHMSIKSYIALNIAYQCCGFNDLIINSNETNQLSFGRRKVLITDTTCQSNIKRKISRLNISK